MRRVIGGSLLASGLSALPVDLAGFREEDKREVILALLSAIEACMFSMQ